MTNENRLSWCDEVSAKKKGKVPKDGSEILTALIEGKVIYDSLTGKTIDFDGVHFWEMFTQAGTTYRRDYLPGPFTEFENIKKYLIYEKRKEPEWWENIPEGGRLCWVWDIFPIGPQDTSPRKNIISIISGRAESGEFIAKSSASVGWNYAVPLTDEEILSFIPKPKGEI